MKFSFLTLVFLIIVCGISRAQSPPQRNPDISNKALITKSTPAIDADRFKNQSADATLHKLADDITRGEMKIIPSVAATTDCTRGTIG